MMRCLSLCDGVKGKEKEQKKVKRVAIEEEEKII